MTLTPLEHAILAQYHKAFGGSDFPSLDEIEVVGRENSGVGRFVDLTAKQTTAIAGRTCDLPGAVQVEMEGVEHGLGFVLFLDAGKLDCLELYTYDDEWDGQERPWRLVERARSESSSNA